MMIASSTLTQADLNNSMTIKKSLKKHLNSTATDEAKTLPVLLTVTPCTNLFASSDCLPMNL